MIAGNSPRVYLLMKLASELLNSRGLVLGLKDSVPKLVEDEVLLGGGVVTPLLQLELDDLVLTNRFIVTAKTRMWRP